MATTSKEKVPVDHSAISGAPPKEEKKQEGSFLSAMQETIGKATQAIAAPAVPALAPTKSILSSIHKGRSPSPPRIMLVGTEGVGKSSWAAAAPSPIFVPTEDGLDSINCEKFTWDNGTRKKANTYAEVIEALTGLASEPHSFQTAVIDSADWLEKLIHANVCRRFGKKNIQEIGYAKGFDYALDEWREVLDLLTKCRVRGMATIVIAHAKIEKFEDPELPAYDRYVPKLHKHAVALLKEWNDCVLFASYRRTVKLVEGKNTDERPIGIAVGANGGERILRTVGGAICDAKNRYELPAEMPLLWDAFAQGVTKFMEKSA